MWVVESAPDVSPHWIPVLIGLARHADAQGRGAFPSQELLAEYARKSDRAVRNDLTALEKTGLIRPGDRSLVEHFPPDRRPLVWDLALERQRALRCTGWNPTSGRSAPGDSQTGRSAKNDRKSTSTRSTDRNSASTRYTAGNTAEGEQNHRSGRNDRNSASTRTDRKPTSTRSSRQQNHETAGQEGTTGSPLPTKLSNYVGKQAAAQQTGNPIPDWAQPLIDALGMKGIAVGWGRMSNFQWIAVQQLMKSHGVPYLVYIASTRWNPNNPIRFGTLLLDIWREFPAPPVGSPWHPATQAKRSDQKRAAADKPPHCGDIDCDPDDRMRESIDSDGLRVYTPCPQCHPSRKEHRAA